MWPFRSLVFVPCCINTIVIRSTSLNPHFQTQLLNLLDEELLITPLLIAKKEKFKSHLQYLENAMQSSLTNYLSQDVKLQMYKLTSLSCALRRATLFP